MRDHTPSSSSSMAQNSDSEFRSEHPLRRRATPEGLSYLCIECKAYMNEDWRENPEYPETLCNACGERYNNDFELVEDSDAETKRVRKRRKRETSTINSSRKRQNTPADSVADSSVDGASTQYQDTESVRNLAMDGTPDEDMVVPASAVPFQVLKKLRPRSMSEVFRDITNEGDGHRAGGHLERSTNLIPTNAIPKTSAAEKIIDLVREQQGRFEVLETEVVSKTAELNQLKSVINQLTEDKDALQFERDHLATEVDGLSILREENRKLVEEKSALEEQLAAKQVELDNFEQVKAVFWKVSGGLQ